MAETLPRVLVVDDERFFREAIVEALSEAGIDCEAVASAEECLAAARDPQIGVVILDIALAEDSGLEVMRQLRVQRPSVRVIILSAHTEQELVLQALRLDASDYLAKPLHDEELVLAVRRALAGFDVEASWQRLREQLRRLEGRLTALMRESGEAYGPEALNAFGEACARAVSHVLGADKTSLMVFDAAAAELRVAGAQGAPVDAARMNPVALGEGVAGVALSLGEAVLVDDIYTDVRFAGRTLHERYDSASMAVAPLGWQGEPLGVLCATDRPGSAPFGEDELCVLKLMALQISPLLARLLAPPEPEPAREPGPDPPSGVEAESRGDGELARDVCQALSAEIEPGPMLAAALRPVARRLPGGAVALHLIDNPSGTLVVEAQVDDEGAGDREGLPCNRGLTGTVLQAGSLVATDHPERDPRFDPDVDTAADGVVRPLLCVPLRLRGKPVGALRAFPEAGAEAAARTGELLAVLLSAAVRNVLLYRSLLESIDEVADARRESRGGPRT